MTLNDFEKDFPQAILQRGKKYYVSGAVQSVEKIAVNTYQADVYGSDLYEVTVELDAAKRVTNISCDCPYDMGAYCKHEAAVLYLLREHIDSFQNTTPKSTNLLHLLEKCSHAQLVEIIQEYARSDKTFADYLRMQLSANADAESVVSNFKRIVKSYFRGRSFLADVLKAGELLVEKTEQFSSAVKKIHVYAEVIDMLEMNIENQEDSYDFNDEDSWELFHTIEACSSRMEDAVAVVMQGKKENEITTVWNLLLSHWNGDFQIDGEERFFPSLLQFCVFPEYREKLDTLLGSRGAVATAHEKEKMDSQRLLIIQKYGTEAEEQTYLLAHLDNPNFRQRAIELAMQKKRYAEAEQLTLDGISASDSSWWKVMEWCEKLHDIYQLSGETQKLESVYRALVKNGKTAYYAEWKSLLPVETQADMIEQVLQECSDQAYEYIISCENRSDLLYRFCCKYPQKILVYYEKLKGTPFQKQTEDLYEQWIRDAGEIASSRSAYAELCDRLKKFSVDCGAERAAVIAKDFRFLYHRKPAFMNELTKAGF